MDSYEMTGEDWLGVLGFLVLGLAAAVLAASVVALGLTGYYSEKGYKAACKDAYEGELRYELKKLPGGEVKWVKKKEK